MQEYKDPHLTRGVGRSEDHFIAARSWFGPSSLHHCTVGMTAEDNPNTPTKHRCLPLSLLLSGKPDRDSGVTGSK